MRKKLIFAGLLIMPLVACTNGVSPTDIHFHGPIYCSASLDTATGEWTEFCHDRLGREVVRP